MKKILLSLILMWVWTTNSFAVIENKAGEVVGQMGTTFNERNGKTEKVEKGYIITINDFLQTGEDGGMILHYVDDTKFTMGPGTELIIDEFAFDTSKVPIVVAMSTTVNVGTFTYESGQISNLGGSVEINTGISYNYSTRNSVFRYSFFNRSYYNYSITRQSWCSRSGHSC